MEKELRELSQLIKEHPELKKQIDNLEANYFEIGKELVAIREEKEYPDATFYEFVKIRFNKDAEWADNMIQIYYNKLIISQ